MTEDKPGYYKAIEDILHDRRRKGLTPPRPEELIDYADGELEEKEMAAFLERLVLDRGAIQTLLDLERLPEDPDLADHPDLTETSEWAALENMRDRIRKDQQEQGFFLESRSRSRSGRAWLWAAVLLGVACFFLGLYALSVKQRLNRLLRPTLDAQVVEFLLASRDAMEAGPTLQDWQILRFGLSHQQQNYPRYQVQLIRESDGRVVFKEETNLGQRTTVALLLPRPFFEEAGSYHAVIFGKRDGHLDRLGTIPFVVAP